MKTYDDLFTQYLFLNKKKVSFDDFFMTTWERENESKRKKEPQILRQEHAMFKNTNAKIQDWNSRIMQFSSYEASVRQHRFWFFLALSLSSFPIEDEAR